MYGKSWEGPGVYELTFSATQFVESVIGYRVQFEFIPFDVCGNFALPDAWRFDDAGCQAGRLYVSLANVEPSCPKLVGGNPIFQVRVEYEALWIEFVNVFQPVDPDPATRYALARVQFDHSTSVVGPTEPGVSCGGVDTPLCFTARGEYLVSGASQWDYMLLESDGGVWGGAVGGPCFCSQNETSTWGRVKSMYR